MTAAVLRLWNKWEIEILVLTSFALQVILLIFARMRRRSISRALRILLWLMYLLAEYTATYTLGHMSIGCKPGVHQQLMAFWAPFLLVHIGGQDTITAYAMEDNQLWLRHLLTSAVQAIGAAYVLYKNIGSRGPLVAPAVLMFLVGVLKNGERVWALSFSRLEIIRRYLDGVSIKQNNKDYSSPTPLDEESVLPGAHDLLYICMGQFVDDEIWPSKFQSKVLEAFHKQRKTIGLIEMQLSLMYDIFYTKAAVIHTWYGRCFRAISLLGTAMAFFLFQFSTGKDGYNRVDATVTYILVIGASVLETASVLRSMGSTWTCAMLKMSRLEWLHSLHVSLRRCVRIAQTRRWSGSIGQLNLLSSYINKATSLDSKMISLGRKVISFCRNDSSFTSTDAKELVLKDIGRIVEACEGKDDMMRSYRGQCALERPDGFLKDYTRESLPDGFLKDLTWSTRMEFDQSILAWHLATDKFLEYSKYSSYPNPLVEATKAVSNYMMFLLVERPYMLPSPVRPTLHLKAREKLTLEFMEKDSHKHTAEVLHPGAKLADELLNRESEMPDPKLVLQVVFGVWVEMLCYAAHNCSRESHARQLNEGGEFITIVWLLTTAEFNRVCSGETRFTERQHGSIWNFMNFANSKDFMRFVVISGLAMLYCIAGIFFLIFLPFRVIFLFLKPPRRGAVLREICLT